MTLVTSLLFCGQSLRSIVQRWNGHSVAWWCDIWTALRVHSLGKYDNSSKTTSQPSILQLCRFRELQLSSRTHVLPRLYSLSIWLPSLLTRSCRFFLAGYCMAQRHCCPAVALCQLQLGENVAKTLDIWFQVKKQNQKRTPTTLQSPREHVCRRSKGKGATCSKVWKVLQYRRYWRNLRRVCSVGIKNLVKVGSAAYCKCHLSNSCWEMVVKQWQMFATWGRSPASTTRGTNEPLKNYAAREGVKRRQQQEGTGPNCQRSK